jgi:hypothetical protein
MGERKLSKDWTLSYVELSKVGAPYLTQGSLVKNIRTEGAKQRKCSKICTGSLSIFE